MKTARLFLIVLLLAAGAPCLRAQDGVALIVPLDHDNLLKLPRAEARVKDRGGKDIIYTGVSLADLLVAAGMKFDPSAMPATGAVASYVLVEAADGYKAVFALSEVDPTLSDRVILLADQKDGQPLAAPEGPLRLVAPGDKRPARWVRQVTAISMHNGG